MKRKKLKIGWDVDDTLIPFTQSICDICEKKFKHPFPYEEVVWGFSNCEPHETEYIHQLFKDEKFIKSIPMSEEIISIIKESSNRGHDNVFVTSTYSDVMTTRALYLYERINFIHPRNYIMTGRKDIVSLDIHFDDCLDHIKNSMAEVPVLVTTPWNKEAKGYVRVNNQNDFLEIIDLVEKGYNKQQIYKLQNSKISKDEPFVAVIVGGSGVGKTSVVKRLLEKYPELFEKPVTNTTRSPREGEINHVDYNFCSKKEFEKLLATNILLEHTEYAGNYYGTSRNSVETVLKNNKNVVIVMDIEGAISINEAYPNNSCSIFIERKKEDIIKSILERNISDDEKIKRIIQLDSDFSSIAKCTYAIENIDIEKTVDEIATLFIK